MKRDKFPRGVRQSRWIVHKYVSVQHHRRSAKVVGQLPDKPLSVRVAPKNHVAAVAAAGNMVNRISEVNSGRSSHFAMVHLYGCKGKSRSRRSAASPSLETCAKVHIPSLTLIDPDPDRSRSVERNSRSGDLILFSSATNQIAKARALTNSAVAVRIIKGKWKS